MALVPHIDAVTVRRMADLAHLSLSDEEVGFYQKYLEKILNFVSQLDEVSVPVGSPPVELPPTFERDDIVLPSLDAELAVSQTKITTGTSFRVPRIVE